MFSRRYLRRILVVILVLPVIMLLLFIFYQNHHVKSTENPSHHYDHEHDSHNSHENLPNYNERYQFQSKHSITSHNNSTITTTTTASSTTTTTDTTSSSSSSTTSKLLTTEIQQITNFSLMFRTLPSSNVYNNNEQIQNLMNALQKHSRPIHRTKSLPVIDTKNLHRFVHLDLKGAAPKIDYYKKLFPFLKRLGANGLLIEYEDMFPFTDHLEIIRHGFSYSKKDIQQILDLAEKNHLKVMPLLQVYGHLEYVLKLKQFMHLREDSRYPQVITPCLEESYKLLFEMIDQILSLHPSIPYLHMGCDEVYYRLIHPQCVNLHFRDEADLFIRHVTRIAKYIKLKRPNIKLFIWHDMLSQLVSSGHNNTTELLELVVPMVWAYVDDVKMWFDEYFWTKIAMFPEVWVASSYKGSSGEITTMTYIGHHQRNQQTWLEAMYIASERYKVNFTGIAVTGWSRYDHMLSLCEFLPSSIPSLAYALQTIVFGRITKELNLSISQSILGCIQIPLWERSSYSVHVSCSFPGHEMYQMMFQYDNVMRQYDETLSFVRLYVTDIHIRQNYIHYKRSEECLERLIALETQMIYFIDAFQNASLLFFTADIGPEWLQTYFMRTFKEVQQRINFIDRSLKTQSYWLQRPLPMNTSRIVIKKRNITQTSLIRTFNAMK